MQVKTIEIRDRGTFIPALAIQLEPLNEADRYLLARAGFGSRPEAQAQYIILAKLGQEGAAYCDPSYWPPHGRTMGTAHAYLYRNFENVASGDVVDVEFIVGETKTPKTSERLIQGGI